METPGSNKAMVIISERILKPCELQRQYQLHISPHIARYDDYLTLHLTYHRSGPNTVLTTTSLLHSNTTTRTAFSEWYYVRKETVLILRDGAL